MLRASQQYQGFIQAGETAIVLTLLITAGQTEDVTVMSLLIFAAWFVGALAVVSRFGISAISVTSISIAALIFTAVGGVIHYRNSQTAQKFSRTRLVYSKIK